VLRGQTFAGHALSHVGFTGATGAVLLGISPIWGMVGFTLAAGIGMGALGERLAGRDVAIGVILSGALGFGLLFLHFYTSFATQVTRCCSATCWRSAATRSRRSPASAR
jgi:zinc/manganese transport system permease protein